MLALPTRALGFLPPIVGTGVGAWLAGQALMGLVWPFGTSLYAVVRLVSPGARLTAAIWGGVVLGAGLSGGWRLALAQGSAVIVYEACLRWSGGAAGPALSPGSPGRLILPLAVAVLPFAGIYLQSLPGLPGLGLMGAHLVASWALAGAFQWLPHLIPWGRRAVRRALRAGGRKSGRAGDARAVARLHALAGLLKEMSLSFRETGAAGSPLSPEEEAAMLVSRLAALACHGCPSFGHCWGEGFSDKYRRALELLSAVEEGGSAPADRGAGWDEGCQRPGEVRLAAGHLVEVRQLERRWKRCLEEQRDLMAGHLQGLAAALEELARLMGGEPVPPRGGRSRARPLSYTTEVAKLARPGRLVSGDSHLVKEMAGHKLLLLLSDGMGTGHRAAAESRETVRLVERLLDAGFDVKTVVRLANSIMALRSPDETFATLDLALIDLLSGEAQFVKVGAAPTFLYQRGAVTMVKARSLPLGILDSVEVETVERRLGGGDVIVMVTDGLLEGWGDQAARERHVEQIIRDGARAGPRAEQGLARALLEDVALNLSEDRQDDMTVLVVRLWAEQSA